MSRPTTDGPRVGIWLIGARGGVAVTSIAGLIAQQQGLADGTGLVSTLPPFANLPLVEWNNLVVGGHDIRQAPLIDELERLHTQSRVLSPALVESCREELAKIESRIRPGTLWNVGTRIKQLAEPAAAGRSSDSGINNAKSASDVVAAVQADLAAFKEDNALEQVVVINLASTEVSPEDTDAWPATWDELKISLPTADCPLPASSLYAIAALDAGMPYVNFTPSLGSALPALDDLAHQRGTCHAGRDGKTGETLMKSVLAPMFAARNLEVMSWVGHNIFGNLDGKVLDDPANKQSKLSSKGNLLGDILGYAPQSHISIEHIESLGDWKTAWDHIHFRGFLNTPMTLQFTWQGCDSLLAAPLVLDLARFTLLARERGETGTLDFLASFFKSPLGEGDQAFAAQYERLLAWVNSYSE
ncbi:inositol-3-phosphate synthase [Adhaeretor mobilis]|uniref:Inositol-3-phosphate synthase n=1 Tax=Adhaeretor mobilis TaxID=1930276 RepID=A0A517N1W1_9BACT|nr:inositol-3-phosphate synthase [Adhaeretor mobilis]QDT01127.1 Inositol-3-phosphate synthase [Adhaeretor mobilis]